MAILEPLSYKQQKFCEEYLLSFNAYRAAISAGYTENTARKGDLLHVPKIQAYLKDAMSRSAARAELTHDMLLRELMKIAFCSMGDYYDEQGDPKRMHELTDDEKAAISYFERKDMEGDEGYIKGEVFKIKLHNKMAAIDKLCRHTGFYKAKWQPKVVIQPVETEEDIAFEAESAKTTAQPYTEEVQQELLEQAGLGDVGSQMSDVGEEEEECGSGEWQDLDEVGSPKADVREEGNESKILSPESGIINPAQRSSENILTLSPPDTMEDGECKMEDVVEKNLTLSPLDVMEDGKGKTEDVEGQTKTENVGTAPAGRWAAISRPSLRVAVG